jgi:polar amino acid transport system substrate-binding protein
MATTPAAALSQADACADPGCNAAHVDTLAAIRARGVLRVGVALAAPMVVRAHGTVEGFSVDVARQLAADIGVRVEFVLTTWERVVPDLVDGRTDVVIAGLWPTVERAMRANFTTPTATEGIYLFASRHASGRTKSDFDRPGVRIATFPGTPQALAARRHFPRATHVDVKPDEKEFDLVVDGRADAAVVSTISAPGAVAAARRRVAMPFVDALQSTPAAMAIRKGDPDFLNLLDTWLGIRRGEGWLDERAQHWVGEMEWFSDEAAPAVDGPR